ncbi:MAG: NADH-quinone oxidoreductase subunit NuoK [Chloroflexi bacterium]|nr:NADH-quinone oxidoreductase subunit NuoK [Chloroflexota bacterium]
MPLEAVLVVSAALFCIGLYGVLARRNAVLILMSIELMLNAVNINLIAFGAYLPPQQTSPAGSGQALGQIIAIFVITVAAAEVGLALAIILRLYRNRGTVNTDEVDLMKW